MDALSVLTLENVSKNHRKISEALIPMFNQLTSRDFAVDSVPSFPKNCWFYYPVRESEVFTLAVFALPKGGKLPLHDHPNMTVLCRPLSGKFIAQSGVGEEVMRIGGDE